MDKDLRNLIQRSTQDARRLLEHEYRDQLEGLYDVLPATGGIAESPGAHLDAAGRFARTRIVAAIAHERSKLPSNIEAIAAYLRETAFTTLNRFSALKLMEGRRIVQECVSRGNQSAGFREFGGLAPGLGELPDRGYRLYLECLFDEIGVEVGALFDRRNPSGLLWPRRPALLELLEILNRPGLAGIWGEDETIGWIYQYFNGNDVKEMRDAANGGAPRNSRELAVRNQFFTPRYVVQFLTDNSLGRLWYEMRAGQTRLPELCKFLILPADEHRCERPLKDPRALKIIDPACGSMHFGLYAFEVLTAIYLEAWHDLPDSALRRDYPELALLQRDLPRLIIEHNLHGIDIDPRATQIAGFALWLRAQRAWTELQIPSSARPRIEKSNIVCAEPMAGGPEDIRGFVESAFAGRREQPAFQLLLTRLQEAMQLAGEAGSLLKIEDDILASIAEVKKMAREGPTLKQDDFLESGLPVVTQAEIPLDLSGLTDEEFWTRAEHELLAALSAYAESMTDELHGRLFAQDAARGIGFIHLCRQKYDVALMNPPFGDASIPSKAYIDETYGDTKGDVYKAFVECFQSRLVPAGYLGIISSRTGFFLSGGEDWRTRVVLRLFRPIALADLGMGVLDAMVEVAAYVLRSLSIREARHLTLSTVPFIEKVVRDGQDRFSLPRWQAARDGLKRHQAVAELKHLEAQGFIQRSLGNIIRYTPLWHSVKKVGDPKQSAFPPLNCIRALSENDKEAILLEALTDLDHAQIFVCDPGGFSAVPGSPFSYWVSQRFRDLFWQLPPMQGTGRHACVTNQVGEDFRYYRAYWEVRPATIGRYTRWVPLAKGGAYSPFYADLHLIVDWLESRATYRGFIGTEHRPLERPASVNHFFRPGITWPRRTDGLSFRILPTDAVFSNKGPAIFCDGDDKESILAACGVLCSTVFGALLAIQLGRVSLAQSFEVGLVQATPFPNLDSQQTKDLARLAHRVWREKRALDSASATSHAFLIPALLAPDTATLAERSAWWVSHVGASTQTVATIQLEIDELAFRLYGLDAEDRAKLTATVAPDTIEATDTEIGENEECETASADASALATDMLAYALGAAFGRWDIRFATGQRSAPPEPDPFDPLPICPPGMLQDADGSPATPADVPSDYPLRISWPGILVDDPGNAEDVETRIQDFFKVIWGERAEAIEAEACQLLGVSSLRSYFQKQFFSDHLKRYSKSRRQAPIYWPLSTASGSYTIWLYYHRFTKDTFYRVREIAEEKFQHEERKLFTLQQDAGPNPSTGQSKGLAAQGKFVDELREFRAETARLAPLWNPDLNDGVILNFAPFHRLISHNKWRADVAACWETLVSGKYDWAHLALHLWPERVIPKCATDRSLAIAHGVEETFWEPIPGKEGKYRPKPVAASETERLVAECANPAVKAALSSLAAQPSRAPARRPRVSA